jgi:hypothetical protein
MCTFQQKLFCSVEQTSMGGTNINGVSPEWRLDKTQNFLTQRFALARSGTVNEENAS